MQRDTQVLVRLTPEEKVEILAAAAAADRRLSEWIRNACREQAKREKRKRERL